MARGGLISLLYTKLSDLSVTTANATSSLTLMSADIERITNGWQTMHEVWANCIEIAIAIWLLERQLGASCAIPLAVAIGSFPMCYPILCYKLPLTISFSICHWSSVSYKSCGLQTRSLASSDRTSHRSNDSNVKYYEGSQDVWTCRYSDE